MICNCVFTQDKLLFGLYSQYPSKKLRVVYGCSKEKDYKGCFESLLQHAHRFHLVSAKNRRALNVDTLQQGFSEVARSYLNTKQILEPIIESGDIKRTLEQVFQAVSNSDRDEIVVITGSFFIMQEAREFLGYKDIVDPLEVNVD